jgi:hypothetical protein
MAEAAPDASEDQGFLIDFDVALFEHKDTFANPEPLPYRRELGWIEIPLTWTGPGYSVADITNDVLRLLERVAEESLFLHRTVHGTSLIFYLVTGDGERHLHRARLTIQGDRVAAIVAKFHENRRSHDR